MNIIIIIITICGIALVLGGRSMTPPRDGTHASHRTTTANSPSLINPNHGSGQVLRLPTRAATSEPYFLVFHLAVSGLWFVSKWVSSETVACDSHYTIFEHLGRPTSPSPLSTLSNQLSEIWLTGCCIRVGHGSDMNPLSQNDRPQGSCHVPRSRHCCCVIDDVYNCMCSRLSCVLIYKCR